MIVQAIVTIIVVGILIWLVNAYVPMEARVNQILNGFVVILLVLWLIFRVALPLLGVALP